jgi:uncharacterized membrane protein
MVYLLLGGVGLLIGALLSRNAGWFYGLALGLLTAEIVKLRKRLARIEERTEATAPRAEGTQAPPSFQFESSPGRQVTPPPLPNREIEKPDQEESPPPLERPAASEAIEPPSARPEPSTAWESESSGPRRDAFTDLPGRAAAYVKAFFTTGNVVTKIGVIVLFFGVAFLLKYAAQRNLVPIEFRLILVFLAGLGLLGTGWRFRERRRVYGLILQGGGVGVLYLTVYAAARFYHLLPYGLAFAVMFALVILSGILAVLQDARSLAVFGIVGGFLAPVLISTEAGSHVVLFSYYALLNLGIVLIAWRRAWRELNLIGFFFTFVIASLWGSHSYRPQYFRSTEPFLILFFLYYVALSVLYALRQPSNFRGYVDGTLVFGVPLVAFGLQYGLVRDTEYGLAMSALGLGLFYILLAAVLRRRGVNGLRTLIESFLAFGVVFGSLAIPLALDGRWTSAAWAIEGSAILWIGIRQNRLLPRIFGVLLQAGSGLSFLMSSQLPSREIPVANSFFVGCLLISLAGFFSGWYLTRRSDLLHAWERPAAVPLMVWGVLWWFGAAFLEIERFVAWQDTVTATLVHGALSFLLMDGTSRRLAWKALSYPPLLLLPMMALVCVYNLGGGGALHFFARAESVAWAVAFFAQYRLLWTCEKTWPAKAVPLWHQATLWLLLVILAREAAYTVGLLVEGEGTWLYCAWAAVPGVAVLALLSKGERLSWPIRRFREHYLGKGTALPMAFLFGWTVLINLYPGDPAPLPFVPVINPLELTQLYLLLLMLYWIHHRGARLLGSHDSMYGPVLRMIVYVAGFLLLNAVVARTIHFWAQVPYTPEGLYRSVLFQAALSILWGVTALVTTLGATRKRSRPAWIAGASILTLVVIKLFVVDLAGTGTVARIVSFLFVGSLMLLIGYFSPLPPARTKEAL